MKSVSILVVLAIAISPALSQPHIAATEDAPESAHLESRSSLVPFACYQNNSVIDDQLEEIAQLQSKNLPVTADLAGYFYAVVKGRKLLGCPYEPLFGSDDSSQPASKQSKRSSKSAKEDGHVPGWGDLCEVAQILKEEIMDQITVLADNKIAIPPYLAGSFSVLKDAENNLKCGFLGASMEEEVDAENNSTETSV